MEVIVGMVLFGMVALTISAAIAPLMMAYRRANDLAEYNQILDVIGNRIVGEMSKASSITHGANTVTMVVDNVTVIYSVDGAAGHLRVLRGAEIEPSLVYQQEFYRGKRISFNVPPPTTNNYLLTVTVTSDSMAGTSGATLERSYAVRPLLITPAPTTPP